MVDFTTRREGNVLIPDGAWDAQQLQKLRPGRPFHTQVVFKRSSQHNRWYRGLVSIVADGLGLHPDTLHADLKFKAGMVRHILLGATSRAPYVELHSTAFDAMDEAKFTEFVTLAVEILFRDYLVGVPRGNVFQRVEELVGPRPSAGDLDEPGLTRSRR
jgi:hypothetical protein